MLTTNLSQIMEGVEQSHDPQVIESAKQFYKDNGYKFSEVGKQQALNDLESTEYPPSIKVAVGMAIAFMTLEELKGE